MAKLTKAKKKKVVAAIEQALAEIAESFDISVEELVDIWVEEVGSGEADEKEQKKEKGTKKQAKAEAEAEEVDVKKGDKVKVKVDGRWRRGEVIKVTKKKVTVKIRGGEVTAPKTDIKLV